jgi:hypothetical protein
MPDRLDVTARREFGEWGDDNLLVTLVIGLGCILQPTGILDGDSLAILGLGASARLKGGLGDGHDCDVALGG